MTHRYNISGMSYASCVTKVTSELLKLGDISEAKVQLTPPHATLTMLKHVPVSALQTALRNAGNYSITEADGGMETKSSFRDTAARLSTYKPILLIAAFITGSTVIIEITNHEFFLDRWMTNFMAAFFLTFSFFKLLDVKAFAESYSTYDIVASRWITWGKLYPFIELSLGLAFLANFRPMLTNGVTFVVMALSLAGVVKAVFSKKKIRCACLGAVFNLPMSIVTIVENAVMLMMSSLMMARMIF